MAGYLLIEALVALAIVSAGTALAARVLLEGRRVADTTSARTDLHQRARMTVASLSAALSRAGAGAASGSSPGPLLRFLPAVLAGRGAPPAVGSFAADAIGIISAIDAPPAALTLPVASGETAIELAYDPSCGAPCGFTDGGSVLVFDGHGDFDLFTVTSIDAVALGVRPTGLGTGGVYAAGATVLAVDLRIYYLDRGARELRLWRGWRNDFAVVDHVVDLRFEYLGDTQPPESPAPPASGENCLYASDGTLRPRETFAAHGGRFANLPPAVLSDGPWCGSGATPFDADLLRIRAVSAMVRLEVVDATLRGSVPGWFRYPGTAIDGAAMVRDVELRFELRPLNLVSWR
jgi:hypothetical protein